MTKRFFVVLTCTVWIIGLALGFHAAPAFAQKTIELNFTHMDPAGSKNDRVFHKWADMMAEKSKGQLKIRIFPGAVLVGAFDTYESVAKGVADIGSSFRYSRKGAELTGMISMYFAGIPDAAIGTRILDEIRQKFPAYNKEWQDTKELFDIAIGPAVLITKGKAIHTLADIKDLQMRVPVREAAEMLKAMGGVPVGMPMGELLIGMKKGTVDGASVQLYALESFKLAPTAKYCTLFSLYNPSNFFMVMNWDSYNKLPKDLQKIIDDSRPWLKQQMVEALDESDQKGMAWAKKQGMAFYSLPPEERAKWIAVIAPEQDKMAADLDSKGYPGTAVLKFVRERIKEYVK